MGTSCASTSSRTCVHGPASSACSTLRKGRDQVLAAPSSNGREIRVADDAAVKDPHAPRVAVLALDHPHHGFEGGHIGAVAVKRFVAQGEAVDVDDHGQDDL